jgi:hypothetical protein
VTSDPPGSAVGVVEMAVCLQTDKDILLTVKNTGKFNVIYLKDITLLWSTSSFDYREIRDIPDHKSRLLPGTSCFKEYCLRLLYFMYCL